MMSMKKRLVAAIVSAGFVGGSAANVAPRVRAFQQFPQPPGDGRISGSSSAVPGGLTQSPQAAAASYRIQVGDRIEAKFFHSPHLNESMRVRPDGCVSPQLIGEIQAAGQTVLDLEETLRQKYATLLRRPTVTVTVHEFAPPRLYVAGEVRTPGVIELKGPMTTLQSILSAGGFTPDAKAETVALLRYTEKGPAFVQLNLKPPFRSNRLQDVPVAPFDVIYVPKTRIASVADFFGRYVSNIVPLYRNLGLAAWWDLNNSQQVQVRSEKPFQ